MKNISIVILAMLLATGLFSAVPDGSQLSMMTRVVEGEGVAAFKAKIQSERWTTPFIPSRWYLDNVASQSERDEVAAARNFGYQLALALDRFALKMRGPLSAGELVSNAKLLIELSVWCAANDGLDNVLLARRCDDLARVLFVRLVADLSVPMDVIEDLHHQFRTDWLAPQVRAQVLNRESGAVLIEMSSLDSAKAQRQLESVWRSGRYFLQERRDPALKAARLGDGKNAGKYSDIFPTRLNSARNWSIRRRCKTTWLFLKTRLHRNDTAKKSLWLGNGMRNGINSW